MRRGMSGQPIRSVESPVVFTGYCPGNTGVRSSLFSAVQLGSRSAILLTSLAPEFRSLVALLNMVGWIASGGSWNCYPVAGRKTQTFGTPSVLSRPDLIERLSPTTRARQQPPRGTADRFMKVEHHYCRSRPATAAVPEFEALNQPVEVAVLPSAVFFFVPSGRPLVSGKCLFARTGSKPR